MPIALWRIYQIRGDWTTVKMNKNNSGNCLRFLTQTLEQRDETWLESYLRSHTKRERLPWWLRQKRILLQWRRLGFDLWVGKIPWRREWRPTPVFLPGEFHGQRSMGSQRVRHDWANNTHTYTHTHTLPPSHPRESGGWFQVGGEIPSPSCSVCQGGYEPLQILFYLQSRLIWVRGWTCKQHLLTEVTHMLPTPKSNLLVQTDLGWNGVQLRNL